MKFGQRNKIRKFVYVISAIVLAIVFFREIINYAKDGVEFVLYPLKSSVYNFSLKTKENLDNMFKVKEIAQNNRNLKDEYFKLKIENLRLSKYERENERLREVLELKKKKKYIYTSANVVFRDSFSVYENFIIDKGKEDGIEKDMVVLYKDILVGKISEVYGNRSRVDLLSKNGLYVSAMTSERKDLGVIKGQNTKHLKFEYIIIDADIKLGDKIISSGVSEIYPKNILIGYITNVQRGKNNLFKEIEVDIPYNILELNEVLILKKKVDSN